MNELTYDIRFIGRTHPAASLVCPICHGRGWAFFEDELQITTVQKCDLCKVFYNDVDAASTARKFGIDAREEFPCYVMSSASYISEYFSSDGEVGFPVSKGRWYFREIQQSSTRCCQIFDENNQPVVQVGRDYAERIVDGVNNENKVSKVL